MSLLPFFRSKGRMSIYTPFSNSPKVPHPLLSDKVPSLEPFARKSEFIAGSNLELDVHGRSAVSLHRGNPPRNSSFRAGAMLLSLFFAPLPGPSRQKSRMRMRSPAIGLCRRNQNPTAGLCGPPPWGKGKGQGACAVARGDFAGFPKLALRACAALALCLVRREQREPRLLAGVPGPQPAIARHLARRGPGGRAEL